MDRYHPWATFLQIAQHCNREQFNALIGTIYPGIVVSDRWNGYSHLDPKQRQVCWSHLQRDFRRHADSLSEQSCPQQRDHRRRCGRGYQTGTCGIRDSVHSAGPERFEL